MGLFSKRSPAEKAFERSLAGWRRQWNEIWTGTVNLSGKTDEMVHDLCRKQAQQGYRLVDEAVTAGVQTDWGSVRNSVLSRLHDNMGQGIGWYSPNEADYVSRACASVVAYAASGAKDPEFV